MTAFRSIIYALLIALLSSWGGTAVADGLSVSFSLPSRGGEHSTDINVTWTKVKFGQEKLLSGPCVDSATLIFTTASHPGGNKRGLLNEHNGGRGGRCYLDRDKHFYVVVAALINSQYGDTFAFGPGVKWRLFELSPTFGNVSLDIGAEVPFVHYSYGPVLGKYMRAKGRAINSPLPMLWVGVNIKLGNVEIGMMQLQLPQGAAQLRATVIEGSFAPLQYQDQQRELIHTMAQGPRDRASVPTIFLRYSFKSLFGL